MKIPVYCSLIPAELIVHLGHEPVYLEADRLLESRPTEYHCAFHENLCSYSKALYDFFLKNHEAFGRIVVPTACDALKKLHNALLAELPSEKLVLLDVPQIKKNSAKSFLAEQFSKLAKALGEGTARVEDIDKPISEGQEASATKIGILGANVPMSVIEESLKKYDAEPVYLNHCLVKSYLDSDLMKTLKDDGLTEYAAHFLEVNRCPRTDDETYKESIVEEVLDGGLSGIIVNTLKFCDYQPFDYHYYQRKLGSVFPMLQIEHELTSSSEGQLATRIEAFMEGIKGRLLKRKKAMARNGGRFFVGIDSGSHATKLVCIDKDYSIVAREVVSTGTSVRKSAETLLEKLKDGHKVSTNDIGRLVATGYGRNKIEIADDIITEISCHGLGVHHILGKAGTIIDIGGQDSKAIKIDGHGAVIRFAMNDKCAAGTGRFLEVMANKLEMTLGDFSTLATKAKKHVAISSMCSVFAESEVISLIASGCSKEEIAKGIHRSIAERTIALAKRIDGEPPYYMAGGVAQNAGLVQELEESLGETLKVIDYPQFSGALGAAIMALREVYGND